MFMRALLVVLLISLLCITACTVPNESVAEHGGEEVSSLSFLNEFTEYGYTAEQIQEMKTILLNVGINEVTELEIQPIVYGMQTIQGKVANEYRKDIDIQINIENGVIYLITIYCSNTWTTLDGLTDERADLYYDVEGGYLKKIDWENQAVIDY